MLNYGFINVNILAKKGAARVGNVDKNIVTGMAMWKALLQFILFVFILSSIMPTFESSKSETFSTTSLIWE